MHTGQAYKLIIGGVRDVATLAERMGLPEDHVRAILTRLESEGFLTVREIIEVMPRDVTERKMVEAPFPDEDVAAPREVEP